MSLGSSLFIKQLIFSFFIFLHWKIRHRMDSNIRALLSIKAWFILDGECSTKISFLVLKVSSSKSRSRYWVFIKSATINPCVIARGLLLVTILICTNLYTKLWKQHIVSMVIYLKFSWYIFSLMIEHFVLLFFHLKMVNFYKLL